MSRWVTWSGIAGLLLASSFGCTPVDVSGVAIAIAPTAATLEPGETVAITATVTGTSNVGVVWSTSCGEVVGSGATVTYVAPDVLGACYVYATSRVNASRIATAQVDVVLHDSQAWAWQHVVPAGAEAYGVAVDDAGDVVVAGMAQGVLFGDAAGGFDAVVAKYASDGQRSWGVQAGVPGRDAAYAVAVDEFRVLVAGATDGALFGDHQGSTDAFVWALFRDGGPLWARQIGTSAADVAHAVAVDSGGRVWVAGHTHGALYGPVGGTVDGFVAVFDVDGDLVWGRHLDGAGGSDYALALAMDGDEAVVAGYTNGVLGAANLGEYDAFLVRLDADGNEVWTRQFGTEEWESARAVAVDGDGRAWVGGYTLGQMAGPEHDSYDAFVTGFDRAGTRLWTRQPSSSLAQSYDDAHGVAVDAQGRVVLVGASGGDLVRPSGGGWDAFAIAFEPDGEPAWSLKAGTGGWDAFRAVAAHPDGDLVVAGSLAGVTYGQGVVEQDLLVAKLGP